MSKKTDAIYECLTKLEQYQQQLQLALKNLNDENAKREIDNINFGFNQELKTLRFWIDSLYKYNGKSRSISKKNASVANGKKGGRPPKEISLAKKRIFELENEIIPDLEHKIVMSDSNEELESNQLKINKAKKELDLCKQQIVTWKSQKSS